MNFPNEIPKMNTDPKPDERDKASSERDKAPDDETLREELLSLAEKGEINYRSIFKKQTEML